MDDVTSGQDRVYTVVQGIAVAQDGLSASLIAPNGKAQEKLLRSALADGGAVGKDVDYLEAHGTGTALGDPIEIGAVVHVGTLFFGWQIVDQRLMAPF